MDGNVSALPDNITYYLFEDKITYGSLLQEDESLKDAYDITPIMKTLIDKCCHNTGVMIVHDFSGQDNKVFNIIFEKQLSSYHHKVLFDLSDGEQVGCYLDLKNTVNHVCIGITANGLYISDIRGWTIEQQVMYINKEKLFGTLLYRKIQRRIVNSIQVYKSLYFNTYRRAMLWLKSTGTPNEDICRRVIAKRDLLIIDALFDTKLVNLHSHNNVKLFISIIEQVHHKKKAEIECIVGCKFSFDDPDPNNWLNKLNSVLE